MRLAKYGVSFVGSSREEMFGHLNSHYKAIRRHSRPRQATRSGAISNKLHTVTSSQNCGDLGIYYKTRHFTSAATLSPSKPQTFHPDTQDHSLSSIITCPNNNNSLLYPPPAALPTCLNNTNGWRRFPTSPTPYILV